MISEKKKKEKIHLTLKNQRGSVEHYYHFLLGFLIPLTLWWKEYKVSISNTVYIRSCGIMDEHIFEIGLNRAKFLDKVLHGNIRSKNNITEEYLFIQRAGYDCPNYYNLTDFSAANLVISEILSEDIANYSEMLNLKKVQGHPCIVMIDRGPQILSI